MKRSTLSSGLSEDPIRPAPLKNGTFPGLMFKNIALTSKPTVTSTNENWLKPALGIALLISGIYAAANMDEQEDAMSWMLLVNGICTMAAIVADRALKSSHQKQILLYSVLLLSIAYHFFLATTDESQPDLEAPDNLLAHIQNLNLENFKHNTSNITDLIDRYIAQNGSLANIDWASFKVRPEDCIGNTTELTKATRAAKGHSEAEQERFLSVLAKMSDIPGYPASTACPVNDLGALLHTIGFYKLFDKFLLDPQTEANQDLSLYLAKLLSNYLTSQPLVPEEGYHGVKKELLPSLGKLTNNLLDLENKTIPIPYFPSTSTTGWIDAFGGLPEGGYLVFKFVDTKLFSIAPITGNGESEALAFPGKYFVESAVSGYVDEVNYDHTVYATSKFQTLKRMPLKEACSKATGVLATVYSTTLDGVKLEMRGYNIKPGSPYCISKSLMTRGLPEGKTPVTLLTLRPDNTTF